MSSMRGRVALVTGAARGLGPAIAEELIQCGASVALQGGAEGSGGGPSAVRLAAELRARGGETLAVTADPAEPLAAQRMVDEVYRWLGRVDVLINATERSFEGPLLGITADEWQQAFRENVHATFHTIQAVAKYMVLDRRGRIVTVTGLAGAYPMRAQSHYAATLGALDALTRALAIELAPKNITVNAVAPGLLGPAPEPRAPERGTGSLYAERLVEKVPLQRLGTAHDVAALVGFLASDDASYITGEIFYVDGGLGGRR